MAQPKRQTMTLKLMITPRLMNQHFSQIPYATGMDMILTIERQVEFTFDLVSFGHWCIHRAVYLFVWCYGEICLKSFLGKFPLNIFPVMFAIVQECRPCAKECLGALLKKEQFFKL